MTLDDAGKLCGIINNMGWTSNVKGVILERLNLEFHKFSWRMSPYGQVSVSPSENAVPGPPDTLVGSDFVSSQTTAAILEILIAQEEQRLQPMKDRVQSEIEQILPMEEMITQLKQMLAGMVPPKE